jgi:hypothetical protein
MHNVNWVDSRAGKFVRHWLAGTVRRSRLWENYHTANQNIIVHLQKFNKE